MKRIPGFALVAHTSVPRSPHQAEIELSRSQRGRRPRPRRPTQHSIAHQCSATGRTSQLKSEEPLKVTLFGRHDPHIDVEPLQPHPSPPHRHSPSFVDGAGLSTSSSAAMVRTQRSPTPHGDRRPSRQTRQHLAKPQLLAERSVVAFFGLGIQGYAEPSCASIKDNRRATQDSAAVRSPSPSY